MNTPHTNSPVRTTSIARTPTNSIMTVAYMAAIAAIVMLGAYFSVVTTHAEVLAPTIQYTLNPSGVLDQEQTDSEGHDVIVIDQNANQAVSWSSTDATECHVPPAPPYYNWQDDAINGATSGTFNFNADSGMYFALECTGEGGTTSKILQVAVTPTPDSGENHAPTITLNGDSVIFLTVGDVFVENGVTTDDVDGDILTISTSTDPVSGVDMSTTSVTVITYTATDPGGLSASVTRTVNVNPPENGTNHAPTISLIGAPIINLTVGNPYIESGVTASDSDGDAVTVSTTTDPAGGVTTTESGTWVITYTATDTFGLTASTTRTVIVNPTPPIVTGNPPTLVLSFNPAGELDVNQTAQYGHEVSWVERNGAETLSWTTTNATECHLPPPTPYYDWQDDDINGATSGSFNYIADSNMTFALTCTGPEGSVTRIIRSIVHPDGSTTTPPIGQNHAPTISLNGPSIVYLTIGGSYSEQGVTSNDIDGDALALLISTDPIGGLDLTASSTWRIIYTVTDPGGLSASTTRTLYVSPAPPINEDAPTIAISISGTILDQEKTDQEGHDIFVGVATTTRTLSWSSTNATECHVPTPPPYYDWTDEAVAGLTAGSYELPSNFGMYLVLECAGNAGTTTKIFQLVIAPTPDDNNPNPDENHAPVLTLNGDSTIYLTIGDTYVEQGVTVSDIDGDVVTVATTSDPVTGVDTSHASITFITYMATDPGGLSNGMVRAVYVNPPIALTAMVPDEASSRSSTPSILVNKNIVPEPIGASGSKAKISSNTSSCSIYLNENLTYGDANNPAEVYKLQAFLNEYLGTDILMDGVFGIDTFEAVKKFQMEFKDRIITPWVKAGLMKDTNKGTGRVYKTTRQVINNLVCPELKLPQPELV